MAEIQFDTDAVNDARNFLIQYLMDCGYEGSVEDGTAIHDALIKPMALLLVLFKSEADKARAYFSLDKAYQLKESLGEEYDTVVDSILGNWFVNRRQGSDTEADIKLIFSKPLDYLRVVPGQAIVTIEGSEFEAKAEKIFVEEDFSVIANNVTNTNEYSVELSCKTMEPSDVSLSTESVVTSHLSNIYLQRAVVAGSIKSGSDIESSDDFISRTEKAITTRELVSDRAIKVVLLEELEDVVAIYVAGHGTDEMLRDKVLFETATFTQITVKVGNMADIYLKSIPVLKSTSDYEVEAGSVIQFSNISDEMIEIVSIKDKSATCGRIRMFFTDTPASLTILGTDTFTIDSDVFTTDGDQSFVASDFLSQFGTTLVYIDVEIQNTGGTYIDVIRDTVVVCDGAYADLSYAVAIDDFGPLPVEFTLSGVSEIYWNTSGVYSQASIPTLAEGAAVQVDYLSTDVISDGDAIVGSDEQKIICYSPMCRSMFTVCIEMEVEVRAVAEPTMTEIELEARVAQVSAEYTNNIDWQRTFSISEYIHHIHENIPDVEQILLPGIFTAYLRDPADLTVHTSQITGVYSIPDGLSAQVTWQTLQFYTDPSWVTAKIYR